MKFPNPRGFGLVGCLLVLSLVFNFLSEKTALGQDWPQAQGPNRDNKSSETGLLQEWPEGGPPQAWISKAVGLGYSGPAIVGDQIFIMGARDGKTELIALSASDGSEQWSLAINEKAFTFDGNAWGAGPRATPSVSDGHVYALAGDGQLLCATTSGEEKWRVHMQKDLGGAVDPIGGGPKLIGWGYCWSPLVDGDKVICVPGGEQGMFAALDKKTGKVLWRSKELTKLATYASPLKASIHGVDQYITMTPDGSSAVSAEDGSLLWSHERSRPYGDVAIPTPVVSENLVYTNVGYDAGCELIEASMADGKWSTESLYSSRKSRNMKNKLGGFVLIDGCIYGTADRRGWVCQDLATGDLNWYKRGSGGLGDGSIIYADGKLYLFSERENADGLLDVGLLDVSTEEWNLISSFGIAPSQQRAPSGRAWTHPVIAGGHLYLRDQELLYSFKLK